MLDKEFDYLQKLKEFGNYISSDEERSLEFLFEVYTSGGRTSEYSDSVYEKIISLRRRKKINNILNGNI